MKILEVEVQGNFISGAHEKTGTASLNAEESILIFTDLKTDNGPLLEFDLLTDEEATEYAIPSGTDLTKYKYVLIGCVDFSVSFGYAILE